MGRALTEAARKAASKLPKTTRGRVAAGAAGAAGAYAMWPGGKDPADLTDEELAGLSDEELQGLAEDEGDAPESPSLADIAGLAGGEDPEAVIAALMQGMLDAPSEDPWGDVASWMKLAETRAKLIDQRAGAVTLPDGTRVTREMYDGLSDFERQYVDAQMDERDRQIENDYAETLNKFNLGQYGLEQSAVKGQNEAAQAGYNNQRSRFGDMLALDEANLSQAAAATKRQLDGMGESRARAKQVADTMTANAGYATAGGKTAFTGADLGPGARETLRQLGSGTPDTDVALRGTGYITLDPAGDLARGDAALGVEGGLPGTPQLLTKPGDIAAPPSLLATGQNAPALLTPRAPRPMPRFPAPPPTAAPSPGVAVGPQGPLGPPAGTAMSQQPGFIDLLTGAPQGQGVPAFGEDPQILLRLLTSAGR